MPEWKGMNLVVLPFDAEHKGYFEAARQHKLVMKKCTDCNLMRWEPGPGCPFCTSLNWEWQEVSGKGTIYSYIIVPHAIQPSFNDWVPYSVILVELDEQRGAPTPEEAVRIFSNLVTDDFVPEPEAKVAIGKRVEVIFKDLDDDFALPFFRLTDEPPQGPVWQHPSQLGS